MSHNLFVFIKHIIFILILLFGFWISSTINDLSGVAAFISGIIFLPILGLSYYIEPLSDLSPKGQDKSLLIRWLIGNLFSLIFFGLSGVFLFWLGNISGILLILIFFAGLTFWYK